MYRAIFTRTITIRIVVSEAVVAAQVAILINSSNGSSNTEAAIVTEAAVTTITKVLVKVDVIHSITGVNRSNYRNKTSIYGSNYSKSNSNRISISSNNDRNGNKKRQ